MKNSMDAANIAKNLFSYGLRARDCETWHRIQEYDNLFADEILENLYEIEVQHLKRQGNSH